MAVTEGNYHLYFNTSALNSEELRTFEELIAEHLKKHEKFPYFEQWLEWADKVKAPKYEAHLDGANSEEVVLDIHSFLRKVAQELPALKAHGYGLVDYVMEGGCLEFDFNLANGQLDWEETNDFEEDEEWEEE